MKTCFPILTTTYGSLDRTSRTARLTPRLTRILRRPSKLSILDVEDRPPRDGGVLGDDISLPLPPSAIYMRTRPATLPCDATASNISKRDNYIKKTIISDQRKVRNKAPCDCSKLYYIQLDQIDQEQPTLVGHHLPRLRWVS